MPDRTRSASSVSEDPYRQIVQSAVDFAVVSYDLNGDVTSWNEGARRVLGWSEQEMLGQPVRRLFTPEDLDQGVLEQEMATAERQGRAMDERWHMRKGGERFWASGELMPLRDDEDGRITGFVKILCDRTHQQRRDGQMSELNEALRATEARLQMALDVGGMGVWQCDLKKKTAQWWPGMAALHGLEADTPALYRDEYVKLVHPQDRHAVAQALQRAVTNKCGDQVEYRVLWPDGSVHWLESRSKMLMDLQGELWRMSGVCLDVTQRKQTERDLKFLAAASDELARLDDYEHTLEKIARLALPHFAEWCLVDIATDQGGLERVVVAHADPAKEVTARALHGRIPQQPGRISGGGPFNVLRTGRSERTAEVTDKKMEDSVPDPAYRAALRELGMSSYLGVPMNVRGRTLGVISFMSAQSGRRYTAQDQELAEDLGRRAAVAIENSKLIRALKDSDRAKDVFLATLAHELRNPLAPVWNGLSIIKRMPQDATRVAQMADMIERQVGQLARLVDDLLDVSRITTGKIELKKEWTDLVTVVNSAIETSRPHIEAAHHQLSLHLPEDESTELEADPVRLAQVFSNLLNNAAKYTRPGGRIEVEVQTSPEQLSVRVRDNGAGIAPQMLDKVFSLFTQVTHPSERSQGGLGIGLSLVDGLVRLHGGSVEARSEGLDQGSEFIVRLPRGRAQDASRQAAAPAPGQAAAGISGPRRILVVDDNQDAANTLADLLQIMGMEVAVAHDGRSAVSQVAGFAPQVVLLDIGLPDINGYEVARRIRKLEGVAQPRLVALTGWGQDQDKKLAEAAGFDDHWTKPVDPARLEGLAV